MGPSMGAGSCITAGFPLFILQLSVVLLGFWHFWINSFEFKTFLSQHQTVTLTNFCSCFLSVCVQLTLVLPGTFRTTWWQQHSVGLLCTWWAQFSWHFEAHFHWFPCCCVRNSVPTQRSRKLSVIQNYALFPLNYFTFPSTTSLYPHHLRPSYQPPFQQSLHVWMAGVSHLSDFIHHQNISPVSIPPQKL